MVSRHLGTILEKFIKNGLLLVIVDIHTLTLYRTIELVLALLSWILVVVSW